MSDHDIATTDEILIGADLAGTTAVVTGASSGLGAETARALASAGADVVLAVRDLDAGGRVAGLIADRHPASTVEVAQLDLASLASVRAFCDGFLSQHETLDLLINNAGVMGTPLRRTAEGFEEQFGVNHLGHFLLTNLLLPALEASGRARVINVSSGGHTMSDIIWDDPNYLERAYDKWEAYGQSKTANILFTTALDRRLAAHGGHAYAVHPGLVDTNLARYLEKGDFKALMERGRSRREAIPAAGAEPPAPRVPVRPVETGAATTVWAAVAPLEGYGGAYLEDCSIGTPSEWAIDPDAAERLWILSESLVGPASPT